MESIYGIRNIKKIIAGNPYVGRGIILGLTPGGTEAVSAYFIMGRSANSRNRIFALRDGALFTEPFDASKVEDPSLIIYSPLRIYKNRLIVTNGDQTDTVLEGFANGRSMYESLKNMRFEPDAPNLTPRISGVMYFEGDRPDYELSILKSGDPKGNVCNRYMYSYESLKGVGHFIHTYMGDGDPLPSYCGEPKQVMIPGNIDEFTRDVWEGLNEDNRISLYVRYTNTKTMEYKDRLINKNEYGGFCTGKRP